LVEATAGIIRFTTPDSTLTTTTTNTTTAITSDTTITQHTHYNTHQSASQSMLPTAARYKQLCACRGDG